MSLNMDAPGPETFGINNLMDCINFGIQKANNKELKESIINHEHNLNQEKNLYHFIIYSRIKQQQIHSFRSLVLNKNFKKSLVNKFIG